MNLRDEEQLQKYFERSMSSGEEQNFLIDVAARDEMRLAFRSNLELLKALRADKDAAILPAALVRNRTLAALGIGATLASGVSDEKEVAQTAGMPLGNVTRLWSFLRRPAVMLSTGLIAGAAATYSILPSNLSSNQAQVSNSQIVRQLAPSEFIISEPAPEVKQTTAVRESHLAAAKVMRSSVATQEAAQNQKNKIDGSVPVVSKTNAGSIGVDTKVHKEGEDSRSK